MTPTIVFRVDASAEMGGGHVSRCSALANALITQGYTPYFVSAYDSVLTMLPAEISGTVINAEAGSADDLLLTETILKRLDPCCVVIDGYHFDSAYLQHLAQRVSLVVIDDENNRGLLFASVLINQTAGIEPDVYRATAADADLLLGNQYALLSRAFIDVCQKDNVEKNRLLICFGASDVCQRTFPVVRMLGKALGVGAPVDVVCGKLSQQVDEIKNSCAEFGFNFFYNANNMPQLMQQTALAVAAPGTLLYELACLGVPAVFVIAAENQVKSAAYHQQQGWCVVLGQEAAANSVVSATVALWSDPVKRQTMSSVARQQVDGLGAIRIAEFLHKKFHGAVLKRVGSESVYDGLH